MWLPKSSIPQPALLLSHSYVLQVRVQLHGHTVIPLCRQRSIWRRLDTSPITVLNRKGLPANYTQGCQCGDQKRLLRPPVAHRKIQIKSTHTIYDAIKAEWILTAPDEFRLKFLQGLNDRDGFATVKVQRMGNACGPNVPFVK